MVYCIVLNCIGVCDKECSSGSSSLGNEVVGGRVERERVRGVR